MNTTETRLKTVLKMFWILQKIKIKLKIKLKIKAET